MPTAKGQPKALERLIAKLQAAIGTRTADLANGDIDVEAWQTAMERELTKFHASAYLSGSRQTTLDELARKRIAGDVRVQLQYLDNFTAEIQHADEFEQGWQARAESYADSIKIPYWAGRTKVLPLPAMPGEGTQCLTHCKCLWSVDTLDEDAGDYDATWIRNASDSCQTCIQRAQEWAPLRIRAGVLQ